MIELRDPTIANSPLHPLLSGASLTIPRGTLTALIGRNGCGKSTLLRVMAGLQRPVSGEVLVNGMNVGHTHPRELARELAFVATDRVEVSHLTARELVSLARSPYTGLMGRLSADDERIVDKALADVEMSAFANREVGRLSDGEARRVMIARALAQTTPVILLDEPTSFLDVPGRREVCALLARLAFEGKTVVFSTHEFGPAFARADRVLMMAERRLTLLPPAEMEKSALFRATFGD